MSQKIKMNDGSSSDDENVDSKKSKDKSMTKALERAKKLKAIASAKLKEVGASGKSVNATLDGMKQRSGQ